MRLVVAQIGDLGKAIQFNNGSVEFSHNIRAAEAEANSSINLVLRLPARRAARKSRRGSRKRETLYERERWNRWRFYEIRHQAAEAELRIVERRLGLRGENAKVLLDNASRYGVPKYIATAQRLRGEIAALNGDHNTAEDELTKSLELFAAHPMPLIEWRHHASLARLLASCNRPAAAGSIIACPGVGSRSSQQVLSDPTLRDVLLWIHSVREVLAGAAGC